MSSECRVLILGHRGQWRKGLVHMPLRGIVPVFGSARKETVRKHASLACDLVLVDFRRARRDNFGLLEAISAAWPDATVVLTDCPDGSALCEALRRGRGAWVTAPIERALFRSFVLERFEAGNRRRALLETEAELQKNLRELEALRRSQLRVSSSLELSEVLGSMLDEVGSITGYDVAVVLLDAEDGMSVAAARGFGGSDRVAAGVSLPKLTDSLVRHVLRSERPAVLDASSPVTLFEGLPEGKAAGSTMLAPLRHKDRLIGLLLLHKSAPGYYQKKHIPAVEAFAAQSAAAVDNARLHREVQRKVTELSALIRVGEVVCSTLDPDQVLEEICRRGAEVMNARICTIRLVERGELSIGGAWGYRHPAARRHRIKLDLRLRRIVDDHRPLAIADMQDDAGLPASRRSRMRRERVRAYLGVPMLWRGRCVGVLSFYRSEPHTWVASEINFAQGLANQAAVAIENARAQSALEEVGRRRTPPKGRGRRGVPA